MPFFSPNGSVGFNTILCAVFNDYLPVGFGTLPLPVHTNYHQQQAYWTARHDYGHCFNRVLTMKNDHPDFFNYCKNIYFGLFQEMQAGEIDEKTLKKELLVLFFMVYELGGSNVYRDSIERQIIDRTRDMEQGLSYGNSNSDYYYIGRALYSATNYNTRKKLAKSERSAISQKDKEEMKSGLNYLTVLETADFVKPLKDLGYPFPDDVNKRPWKAAPGLRKGLLAIFEDFNQRHPDFFVAANRVTPNHALEDPKASEAIEIPVDLKKSPVISPKLDSTLESSKLSEKTSSLSDEQQEEIHKVVLRLTREIESCWPYPNKDLKAIKVEALTKLCDYAKEMSIPDAIAQVKLNYPMVLEGKLSTRTADLFVELESAAVMHKPSMQ